MPSLSAGTKLRKLMCSCIWSVLCKSAVLAYSPRRQGNLNYSQAIKVRQLPCLCKYLMEQSSFLQ